VGGGWTQATHRSSENMPLMKALMLAAIAFVGAALLAVLLPSTWPLVVARIVLICLGVVVVVVSLRKRQRRGGNV
jgi:Flp pilus assembly protein TadB